MSAKRYESDNSRWDAVQISDNTADGRFYYAVITTGVYCRPSCNSKLPNRKNVEFYNSCDEAEKSGFRPCKRCRPREISKQGRINQTIIDACRIIEASEVPLKLSDLASISGMSPHHFHRQFKKIVGVTPHQYTVSKRAERFQKNLKKSSSVTDAIYSSGFNSSGSAYENGKNRLAMMPKTYRNGAAGLSIVFGFAECYLGWVLVAATDRGVCAIELADTKDSLSRTLQERFPNAILQKGDDGFNRTIQRVVEQLESPSRDFDLPLDIQGTAFQQRVWRVLQEIEPGQTMSYSEVATKVGKPKAARAVATACAANRIAVAIPCHRVIAKDGQPGKYRWGEERKKTLLESEKGIEDKD